MTGIRSVHLQRKDETMSILKLQTMAPITHDSAVAVLSTTSSSSNCCNKPNKPGV
jgi:hypothetical protein